MEKTSHGKIVAIDVETGVFEVAEDSLSASKRYVGNRKTTVKDRKKDIGKGLLNKMLADLAIAKDEFPHVRG